MTTVVTQFVTITCDECQITAQFAQTPDGEAAAVQANPWITSIRIVGLPDNSKFIYCSDECEVKATGKGKHNKKQIVTPTGANSVEAEALAAARAQAATAALKSGEGKIKLS